MPAQVVDIGSRSIAGRSSAADDVLIGETKGKGKDSRSALFRRWFENSYRSHYEWRKEYIEDRKFVAGQQWEESTLRQLRHQGRPAITINKILGPVMFLQGVFSQQREEPQFLPQEAGDARPAELMNQLYKWAGSQCNEEVVDDKEFLNKIIGGLSYWKLSMDFSNDLEGDLVWEAPDPLSIFPDPNFLDGGWRKIEYVIHAEWRSVEQAMGEWPEHKELIRSHYGEWIQEAGGAQVQTSGQGEDLGDTLANQREWWDPGTQRLRLLEIQYKMRETVTVAIGPNNETTAEPDEIKMLREAAKQNPDVKNAVQFVRVPQTRVRFAYQLGDVVLDDDESPYDQQEFSIFPDVGYYFWDRPFGVVNPMKDPQREKNRRRSTVIEIVQRASLSGFLNHATRGADQSELNNYAAGVGKNIPYKEIPPQPIPPPDIPQALIQLEMAADRDLQTVTNLNAELMGNTTQKTVSGRAIEARQRSGITVQEPLLGGTRMAKVDAVKFAIGLIQQFYSPSKALRIIGVRQERLAQQGGSEQLDAVVSQLQGDQQEAEYILSQAFQTRFDVIIGSRQYEPSIKQQQANLIFELAEKFPTLTDPITAIEALKDAGGLTEENAKKMKEYAQMVLQMQFGQALAAQQGAPPAEPPPQ